MSTMQDKMKYKFYWKMDVAFTEKLIREVKSRPVLYSINHPDYKNNVKKFQAWKNIQKELNEDVATLKAKWKNLKDTYKKHKQAKQRTGCRASKKLHNWAWADHMCFIEPSLPRARIPFPYVECDNNSTNSTCNSEEIMLDSDIKQESDMQEGDLQECDIQEDDLQEGDIQEGDLQEYDMQEGDLEECDVLETKKSQQIYKNRKISNTKPRDGKIQYIQNKTRDGITRDGVDLLFLGYADTLKKLSKRKQIKVKFDIAKIMMEAELSDLDAATSESQKTCTGPGGAAACGDKCSCGPSCACGKPKPAK